MNTLINTDFRPLEEKMKQHGKKWITEQIDDDCINYLESFGYHLCDIRKKEDGMLRTGPDAMTTSQLRNFFGEIRRIQLLSDDERKKNFYLLRPKLAYAVAKVTSKQKSNRIKDFEKIILIAHQWVNEDKDNFERFCNFIEGIVAYHKVYGGKDNSKN